MNANGGGRTGATLMAFVFVSLVTGVLVSVSEPQWAVAGVFGLFMVALIFYDYRVGVVCLTLLLPWTPSSFLPKAGGFDLINFAVLASTVSFTLRWIGRKQSAVSLPTVTRWCFLVPMGFGTLLALPYLSKGAANFPALMPGETSVFDPIVFLTAKMLKSLFFVIYAFLLANAVRDSKRPERFLVAFGLSAVLLALTVVVISATTGTAITDRDKYLVGMGGHSNTYAVLLALAVGPLLFLTYGARSKFAKCASGMALALICSAVLLTGSRGGTLALSIPFAILLLQRRRLADFAGLVVLVAVLSMVIPPKVWDRLTLGLDELTASSIDSTRDTLTMGRTHGWALLAPEILESPVWGKGIGSVAWNGATTAGHYRAMLAHNMYLDILLDVGLTGFAALMYLYYRYGRTFRRLARESSLPPDLRAYFAGANASFIGWLLVALTNAWWTPHPEQVFLWFSLGFAFAYWKLANSFPK